MTWDELFSTWSGLLAAWRRQEAELMLRDARKRVGGNTEADWEWLEAALADPKRKHFVRQVFRWQPVPKRLLPAMVRAAVVDFDPGTNRDYLRACVETYGHGKVQVMLEELVRGGVATHEALKSAMYWLADDTSRPRRSGAGRGRP